MHVIYIHIVGCEFLTSLFQKLFAKNNIHPGIGRLYVLYVLRELKKKTLRVFNQNPETKSRR